MAMRSFFLLICSFLAGVVVSGENFFQPLTLEGPDIATDDPVAESFFWKNVNPTTLRYGPLFFMESDDLGRRIEKESPLVLSVEKRGLNGSTVSLVPLVPWLTVEWRGKRFYLTRDGKIWEQAHPLNTSLSGIEKPKAPPFILADDLPSPIDETAGEQVVYHALLPMGSFAAWMDGLSASGWKDTTRAVRVSRRIGHYLLELSLRLQKWNVRLLVRGDQSSWKEYGSAVAQILGEFPFSGEDLIIDTTYTDRIIVRRVSQSGTEGSGR